MAKRPDMQVVGAKVAHLRREKGLCAAAFAREIEQPSWLLMLLESAHMEQSKRLIDLLPDSVIEGFLRDICDVYDVSSRWLTTRRQSPKHPPLPDAEPSPAPLLLPLTVCPEDVITFLDDLVALALPDSRTLLQNKSIFHQSLKAVTLLHQLQLAQLKQSGQEDLAELHRQRFKQLREERIVYWAKELNIPEPDLNEPAATIDLPSAGCSD